MVGILARSSGKMLATFVIAIAFIFLSFIFAPNILLWIQDLSESISDSLRNPAGLDAQKTILLRTFLNSSSILGLLISLAARFVVELFAFVVGRARAREQYA